MIYGYLEKEGRYMVTWERKVCLPQVYLEEGRYMDTNEEVSLWQTELLQKAAVAEDAQAQWELSQIMLKVKP